MILALMQVFHVWCACVKRGGGCVACDQRKGSEKPLAGRPTVLLHEDRVYKT